MVLSHIVREDQNRHSLHSVLREMGISAEQTRRIKRTDSVRVDGEFVYGSQPVFAGETIEVSFPEYEPRPFQPRGTFDTPEILYEDDAFLAVFKPSGVQSHPSNSAPKGTDNMEDRMMSYLSKPIHAVHRLDAETQGILVFAKFPYAQFLIQEAMRNGQFKKQYEAWLYGTLSVPSGTVDAPIERRDPYSYTRIVREDGRPAVTTYETTETREYDHRIFTHVLLSPITGRTHQLRVHMAYLGCPILGDTRYSSDEQAAYQEENCLFQLQLNAFRLSFLHPFDQTWVSVESRLLEEPFWFLEKKEDPRT